MELSVLKMGEPAAVCERYTLRSILSIPWLLWAPGVCLRLPSTVFSNVLRTPPDPTFYIQGTEELIECKVASQLVSRVPSQMPPFGYLFKNRYIFFSNYKSNYYLLTNKEYRDGGGRDKLGVWD